MSKLERTELALRNLVTWVLDNHEGETWLDTNEDLEEYDPDYGGSWRLYRELPEILDAQEALKREVFAETEAKWQKKHISDVLEAEEERNSL